jgi:hypothetical protein
MFLLCFPMICHRHHKCRRDRTANTFLFTDMSTHSPFSLLESLSLKSEQTASRNIRLTMNEVA